jgi:uncharacterized protein with PIN domain/sulfur carrier protein ThiS
MSQPIIIRFHQQLNDFLPALLNDRAFDVAFKNTRSVKDLIESIGIPHTEINLIICNDKSVALDHQVQPGDRIEVYPLSVSSVLSESDHEIVHCQPEPLMEHRFVLDVHLGKLTSYLRMLGFDTLYRNDYDDSVLADISAAEQRILLTCDRKLLMRKQVSYGYYVRNRQPQQQLLEILSRYDLYAQIKPFSRCMHCNGNTRPVSKRSIETQLLEKTKKYYNDFYQCDDCKKIYWKGSHYQQMKRWIDHFKTGDVYKK